MGAILLYDKIISPHEFTWIFLGVFGGIGATSMLIREAMTTRRVTISKVLFYTSGFILLFETIIFIYIVASKY